MKKKGEKLTQKGKDKTVKIGSCNPKRSIETMSVLCKILVIYIQNRTLTRRHHHMVFFFSDDAIAQMHKKIVCRNIKQNQLYEKNFAMSHHHLYILYIIYYIMNTNYRDVYEIQAAS